MGGYQNYGPLLGPPNTRCGIILRTQKGTIILTTTHIPLEEFLRALLESPFKSSGVCSMGPCVDGIQLVCTGVQIRGP